jgi:hypothetical protein
MGLVYKWNKLDRFIELEKNVHIIEKLPDFDRYHRPGVDVMIFFLRH